MYIDLQHILLVITELVFWQGHVDFKTFLFFLYEICSHFLILNVTEVHVFNF